MPKGGGRPAKDEDAPPPRATSPYMMNSPLRAFMATLAAPLVPASQAPAADPVASEDDEPAPKAQRTHASDAVPLVGTTVPSTGEVCTFAETAQLNSPVQGMYRLPGTHPVASTDDATLSSPAIVRMLARHHSPIGPPPAGTIAPAGSPESPPSPLPAALAASPMDPVAASGDEMVEGEGGDASEDFFIAAPPTAEGLRKRKRKSFNNVVNAFQCALDEAPSLCFTMGELKEIFRGTVHTCPHETFEEFIHTIMEMGVLELAPPAPGGVLRWQLVPSTSSSP